MPTAPRQITFTSCISHPSYFLQSSFYPEGGLFFVSYASGSAQLHDTDLDGGFRQLTQGPGIHPFSPAYREGELIFTQQGALWAIEPATLRQRLIVEYPAGASMGEPSLSRDGWAVAAVKLDGQNGLAAGPLHPREPGSGWTFIPFPRTVIHPQFHPLEPEWIEFSGDPAPRMHRVRRDGSGLECLHQHGNDEFIVHETFLGNTGDIVFTVWPHRVCRMDWTTRAIQEICPFNAWHIAPDAAGKRILCDTNHPDRGIHLIDAGTGGIEFVCHSHASSGGSQWKTSRYALAADFAAARSQARSGGALSWMEAPVDTVYGPQWTHPHPSWSHDERQIAFASDQTGVTQVYVCALPA
jgi:hypothetical protein